MWSLVVYGLGFFFTFSLKIFLLFEFASFFCFFLCFIIEALFDVISDCYYTIICIIHTIIITSIIFFVPFRTSKINLMDKQIMHTLMNSVNQSFHKEQSIVL